MARQLYASLRSPNLKLSGVTHNRTGVWSSRNVFSGVTNHASAFVTLVWTRLRHAWLHCTNCEVWWRRDNSFRFWARPLTSSDGQCSWFSMPRQLGKYYAPSLQQQLGGRPFSISTWLLHCIEQKLSGHSCYLIILFHTETLLIQRSYTTTILHSNSTKIIQWLMLS